MDPILPGPRSGRVFATRRLVRSTDVTPSGRLRLDALARYLQLAAEDDLADSGLADSGLADSGLADSGLAEPVIWLLRRCELAISSYPALGQQLAVRTYCSGTGPRWAERTTTLAGAEGELIRARAVWAAIGREDGRPAPLSPEFLRVYGESAGGRVVSARLSHPRPPADSGAVAQGWPLRAADFDIAGHVNNTVHWQAVEDELCGDGWLPAVAEIEYHRAILPGCQPRVMTKRTEGDVTLWLLNGDSLVASALLASARLASALLASARLAGTASRL